MEPKRRVQRLISTKRLIPYHNNDMGSDLDWHDICRSTWSKTLVDRYITQENLNNKKDLFHSFLHNVLATAKERAGYVEDSDGEQDVLEEPYTQAIQMNSDESYNSDDDIRNVLNHGKKFVAKEPIRPGDVIEYYCPVFVYGSKQGLRQATVMSIDPNRKFILELSNGELLDRDHKVKRIKVLSKFEGEDLLLDHPGVTRSIEKFKLLKLNKPHDLKVETESGRLKRVIKGTIDTFMENVKNCDFAPTDMLVRFKGIEDAPRGGNYLSSKRVGTMKEIPSQSDSDDSSIQMKCHHKSGADMRIEKNHNLKNKKGKESSKVNISEIEISSDESDDNIMISIRKQVRKKKQPDLPSRSSSSSSLKPALNSDDDYYTHSKMNDKRVFSLQDSDDESDLQQLMKKKDVSRSDEDTKNSRHIKKDAKHNSSEKENRINLNSSSDESDIYKNSFQESFTKSITKTSECSRSSRIKGPTKSGQKRSFPLGKGSFNDSDSLDFHSDDSLSSSDESQSICELSGKKCKDFSKLKDRVSSKIRSESTSVPVNSNLNKFPTPNRINGERSHSSYKTPKQKSKIMRRKLSPKAKPDLPFFVKKFNNH